MYIAHINENNGEIQSVGEHLNATAKLGREYSVDIFKDIVEAMSKLHDIGKFQPSFQEKIKGHKNLRVEHSLCGAKESEKLYNTALRFLMEYCIAGHHSGIPDGGNVCDSPDMSTLYGRMERKTEDYSAFKSEIKLPTINENLFVQTLLEDCSVPEDVVEKFAFITRYCFSCLTDADSNDTAEFCGGIVNRELKSDFAKCLEKLNKKFDSFVCTTELQKCRSQIQKQVYDKVGCDSEIFLMNMPTGSGKTLCSMKFALERAIKSNKRRIIYIIPYNSIIDQTAEQFEALFGDSAVILRHQSSFSYDDTDYDEDYKNVIKNSAENWNAQIIVTTAVQFFESVCANRRGKLRKMHNMANSILIFDEAHLMPSNYLQPCLRAVSYITRLLGSQAVFLTATMPDFSGLIKEYALPNTAISDLVEDKSLFDKFSKSGFVYDGDIGRELLILQAASLPSSLIVVNKRKTARELFSMCTGKRFHLSTYMTAFDRKNVISQIKDELNRLEADFPNLENVPDDRRIVVVSTSLIEAGVDLDFYGVFRELSGLDSILQAGGRCNREGKRHGAQVHIFTFNDGSSRGSERTNMTRGLIEKYSDISSFECISEYYKRFFSMIKSEIKENAISSCCKDIRSIPFSTYADNFNLIDSKTVSVVFPRDSESRGLVEALRFGNKVSMRKLQKYAFSVYRYEFEDLQKQNVVSDFDSGIWCLTNSDYYDKNIGVLFEASDYCI